MQQFKVYRDGVMWYYGFEGQTVKSPAFETRDAAVAAAQKRVVEIRKAEHESRKKKE